MAGPVVYVAWTIGAPIVVGSVITGYNYFAQREDGIVESVTQDIIDELKEEGVPFLENLGATLGSLSLDFVEGVGEAVVKGVDRTYDYIRDKFIKGREPDIIAGFTIGMLTLLTGVYVWHSVKNARDAL